jgi:hypothetical protein
MANEWVRHPRHLRKTADQGADRPRGRGPEEGGRRRRSSEGGRGRVGRTGGSENQLIKYGSRQTEWAGDGVKVLT